jgi:hypothetical protein
MVSSVKIQPGQVVEADGALTVRYRFEARMERTGELWFSVAPRWRDWIHAGPEPAVAALAFLAMAAGEDIEVAQPVSSRFHYGFQRAVEHFHLWWPRLRAVALRVPGFSHADRSRATAVASCFSGGVDSFHTLYAHLGPAAPVADFRLTHLLFAHGFDIPLANPAYHELAAEFAELARPLGLDVVGLSTNVRDMLDSHLPWDQTHGACLAAAALLLSGGIRRLIIPSTNRQSLLFLPCGSNPVTDPMLGTERLDIVHYGTHLSRIEKIVALAERREAQAHLRVCWQNASGARNCGRCEKCLKTMMPLAVIGALEKFAVFPPLPSWSAIDRRCFTPVDLSRRPPELSYAAELQALAASRGRSLPLSRRDGSAYLARAKAAASALRLTLSRRFSTPGSKAPPA